MNKICASKSSKNKDLRKQIVRSKVKSRCYPKQIVDFTWGYGGIAPINTGPNRLASGSNPSFHLGVAPSQGPSPNSTTKNI